MKKKWHVPDMKEKLFNIEFYMYFQCNFFKMCNFLTKLTIEKNLMSRIFSNFICFYFKI